MSAVARPPPLKVFHPVPILLQFVVREVHLLSLVCCYWTSSNLYAPKEHVPNWKKNTMMNEMR